MFSCLDNTIGSKCLKWDVFFVTRKFKSLDINSTFNPVVFLIEGTIAKSNLFDLTISSKTPE